jgi:F420-0:gamma-glutamyl ligase
MLCYPKSAEQSKAQRIKAQLTRRTACEVSINWGVGMCVCEKAKSGPGQVGIGWANIWETDDSNLGKSMEVSG